MSLESTLGQLMKALKANKRATGTDTWTGKPDDGPLPVAPDNDEGLVEVQVVSKGPSDDMEGLMKDWVKGLILKHQTPMAEGVVAAHPLDHVKAGKDLASDAAPSTLNLEEATLEELLGKLDSLT